MRTLLLLSALALVACDGSTTPDAGARDGAAFDDATLDGGPLDGGASDAGAEDAAPGDAGPPQSPIGAITGACGALDDELTSDSPHWLEQTATYPDGWNLAMEDALSEGAREILADGTAGGSSGYSEAFAFELLHRCEGATLVASETEIEYTTEGSLTDVLVEIDGAPIGVSVTRAVSITGACTREDGYSATRATELLTDKLDGVNESSRNVDPAFAWVKQILFVHADTPTAAAALRDAWDGLDADLRADTVVFVSVSEAMDGFLYFEDRCP
ncbi:MAG TPA: hypothetical protein RMH99_06670 [Sandaracinaceae bacterium LLY-WYZ-13_1]|nr:hypothetical protein [Sandaracinaceae bacterium LLY-WYZ-13_1]